MDSSLSSTIRDVRVVGVTGLEPVTLRLSSACSNQLSYRPVSRLRRGILDLRLRIFDLEQPARKRAFSKSQIANPDVRLHQGYSERIREQAARQPRKLSGLEARGFEPLTSSLQSWRSTN